MALAVHEAMVIVASYTYALLSFMVTRGTRAIRIRV